jgi:signal transduction histidine kinase
VAGLDAFDRLEAVKKDCVNVSKQLQEMFSMIERREFTKAREQLLKIASEERGMRASIADVARITYEHRQKLAGKSVRRERQELAISLVLLLLSLGVALIATLQMRKKIRPLTQLTGHAKAIAAGDRSPLPATFLPKPNRSLDEITELAQAFFAMVHGVAMRDADLSRLRQRQEDIFNHLRAAVIAVRGTIDDQGKSFWVEAANPAADSIFDLRAGDRVEQKAPKLWELVSPDILGIFEDNQFAPHAHEEVSIAPDRVLDVRVVAMQGTEPLALIVADDVTEAATARARALDAERLAAIGKMAAHITHEIRNPLSSLGLNVELLEETLDALPASPEAKRLLGAISKEINRLGSISDDYLRVARLPNPNSTPIDLREMLSQIASFTRPELSRAQIDLTLQVPNEPVTVSVDDGQIRGCIVNLLKNAREACAEGGAITLALAAKVSCAEIVVSDNGVGIADEHRARIFDPFFTTKSTGTGLGLPLTRQIIEAHRGTIECTPNEPRGVRFVISLPRA